MSRKSRAIIIATLALSLVAYTALLLSDPGPPELTQNLPANFQEGDVLFKKRIEERFPIGTQERNVISELVGQGFDFSHAHRMASFERADAICRLVWRVFWETDGAGIIRQISGIYGGICP